MTKRSVAGDIEDVGEEVLRDLTPDKRLRMLIESRADEREQWVDRLHETTPKYDYRMRDHEVSNRVLFAYMIAQHAAYDLWTTWLRYNWLLSEGIFEMVSDLFDLPNPADHLDDEQQRDLESEKMGKVMEMYVDYHAYNRFADEMLDVDLETWLTSMHPDGERIVPAVEETLEIEQPVIDTLRDEIPEIGEFLNEELPDGDYAESLEETIDNEYEHLCEEWGDVRGADGSVGVR